MINVEIKLVYSINNPDCVILYLKFLTCNSSNLTILTPNIEKVKHLIQSLNKVSKRKHSVNWNIDNYISNQLMYEFSVEMESEIFER